MKKRIKNEFIDMFIGAEIGRGISRVVYEHKLDPSLVIKIEDKVCDFNQNLNEWEIWSAALRIGEECSNWFAPCEKISKNGMILIQRKTEPIQSYFKTPEEIPDFLYDTHLSNCGILDGKFVCHDYGLLNPNKIENKYKLYLTNFKMKKVDEYF